MKLLLTGFEAFKDIKVNSTISLVAGLKEELAATYDMTTEILPTVFAVAGPRIRALLTELRPEMAVSLGMAPTSLTMALERVAINFMDADDPDNAGAVPQESPILGDGPAAYLSSIPLRRLCQSLRQQGIPATVSHSAGTYVCNLVMYYAHHTIVTQNLHTRFIFVHVPALPEEVASREKEGKNGASMSLETMRQGVSLLIHLLSRGDQPT